MAKQKRTRPDSESDDATSGENDDPEHGQSPSVCLLCRQRKQKCDRQLPACQHCIKAKVTCQYAPKPQKRGLRAGYVSELERRLEVLEHEVAQLRTKATPLSIPFTPTTPLAALASFSASATSYGTAHVSGKSSVFLGDNHDDGVAPDQQLEQQYLTSTALSNFCEVWFKEYQQWCPIMHKPTVLTALEEQLKYHDEIPNIVLKALVSLTVSHSSQAIVFGYESRRRTCERLRSQVLSTAIGQSSLETLQALLVIAIYDYGYDNFPSAWNLLSICKRICETKGLATQRRDGSTERAPGLEGIAHLPDYHHSQMIYVAWMVHTMDCAISLGARWRPQSVVQLPQLPDNTADGNFSVSVSLQAAFELPFTGLGLVQRILHSRADQSSIELDAETFERSDEAFRVLMSYTDKRYQPSYTLQTDGSITFDTNAVLTTIMANAAAIVLYQRYLMLPSVYSAPLSESAIAVQRCQDACDQMINTISTVADSDVEFISPVLALHLFVAARFHLARVRHHSQRRPARFDLLMHALNMCGRRWPIARRLDIVLRAAIVELDSGGGPAVPAPFWDLRQSALDIDDALRQWVKQLAPTVYVGSLNGPYA